MVHCGKSAGEEKFNKDYFSGDVNFGKFRQPFPPLTKRRLLHNSRRAAGQISKTLSDSAQVKRLRETLFFDNVEVNTASTLSKMLPY